MKELGFELKHAVRRVLTWRQIGTILISSIGLALATIMFAVGWGYSSLSLPFKDADRLVKVGYLSPNSAGEPGSLAGDYQPFFDWRERKDVFTDVAASRRMTDLWMYMTVKSNSGSVRLDIREVTTNFFDTLGVSFSGIQAWKEAANVKNPKTVVFTHRTGVTKVGHESMGKLFLSLDEGGGVIASGILPENFVLPIIDGGENEFAFTPIELKPGDQGTIRKLALPDGTFINNARDPLTVFARLAPGVTPQLAEQMLAGTSGFYTTAAGVPQRLSVMLIGDILTKSSRPIVRYAWALCALILVLCVSNLGGILLTRCTYRLREYALRTALGASLSNLVRTFLLEICGIAVISALVAAFIAWAALPAIADRIPIKHEAFGRPIFGEEAAIFLIIAAAVVMFSSTLPALVVLVRNYRRGFSSGILAAFRNHRALRVILTACQTAIAMLLLCLSWMTVRGYSDIFFRNTGVDTDVRVISVYYPPWEKSQPAGVDGFDTLDVLSGGNPDSRSAAFHSNNVFKDRRSLAWLLEYEKDRLKNPRSGYLENQVFETFRVTPGFFQTLDVKILAGRDFNYDDLMVREIIVNRALVRKMGWTPLEAVGKETTFSGSDKPGTIIGVCEDFLTGSWDSEILPEFYTPISRGQGIRMTSGGTFHYIVHPSALSRDVNIEKTIRGFNPDARITRNASWGDMMSGTVRGRTFATLCVVFFTLAAIAIFVTGIVSTITFMIARRTRDIAIQIAVGAPPIRVCWFVMKDMVMAGITGALIGGMASWVGGKAVAQYIYNGEKYQNLTGLAIAAAVMLLVIATASLLPALRTLRIDPSRALNME